jgi:Zn-dependent protease/CBS domain-containing protein
MRPVRGIRLGRVAGIEVAVDWSLLIIFWLIFSTLAWGVFPSWHPDWSVPLIAVTALAAAVLFFSSVLVHELSHALVGRLNGIAFHRITLFMFGGIAHMEGEPPSWRAELAMAIVGPLTSLAIGVTCIALVNLLSGPFDVDLENPRLALAALGPVSTLLAWLGPVNVIIGLFNLIPGFPMDGGRVLRAIIWAVSGDLRVATHLASLAGQAFAWLLIATGLLMVFGFRVPYLGGGLLSGLWLMLIGWFLHSAAVTSYRQLLMRQLLGHVPVAKLMQTRFTPIGPQMPISTLVDEHLMASGQRVFPVVEDARLLGLVSLADLRKRPREAWARTPVAEIMTPAGSLVSISPRHEVLDALALLGARNLNQLPVVEDGRLLGLVRREDILKWMAIHAESTALRTDDRDRMQP